MLAIVVLALGVAGCGRLRDRDIARGDALAAAGANLQAVLAYRSAVDRDPRSGVARLKLGDAYMRVADVASAADQYKVATELLPDNFDPQVKLAALYLFDRKYDLASARIDAILRRDPRHIGARVLHANVLAAQGDTLRAEAEIAEVMALDPMNRGTYLRDLASVQMAADDAAKAESTYLGAVRDAPQSVQARLHLAAFYVAQHRERDAERVFREVFAIEPANFAAHRALAAFYIGTNRVAEAEEHLKAVAAAYRVTPMRLALADYYLALGRVDEAKAILTAVAGTTDGYGEAHSRLAAIAYEEGRSDEAHRVIDETITTDRSNARALLTKALFLIAERRPDAALPLARDAVAADSRSVAAHATLATLYATMRQLPDAVAEFKEVLRLDPQSPIAQIRLAELQLALGNSQEAGGYAAQALTSLPGDTRARLLLVRALIDGEDQARARREADALAREHPELAEAHALVGRLQLRLKRYDLAAAAFERAVRLDGDAVEPLEGLLNAQVLGGQSARARVTIEQRLAQQPDRVDLLLLSARVYAAAGAPDRAETALHRAIAAEPTNVDSYVLLAQLYVRREQIDRAEQELGRIIERQPKPYRAHTLLGILLEAQGKPADARREYETALAIEPRAAVAANNLAWLTVVEGGNLDVALQLAQAARNEAPEEPHINDTLGWVFYKKDLVSRALTPLQLSVRRQPRNATFWYHLGLAYAKAGQSSDARQSLQQALTIDPQFADAADARRTLQALR